MARSSSESGDSQSDEEYEVEYIFGARWDGTGWEYKVHWYGYESDHDTWEPEPHLTDFGSAGLVRRFWMLFPKKRYSNPIAGTKYLAPADWLADERKEFLANRPKNKPVKGLDRLPRKQDNKIILVGDSESDSELDNGKARAGHSSHDDFDILRSSSEEKWQDEDILRSSSSEDTPLMNRRQSLPQPRAGTSTGPGTKSHPTQKRRNTIDSRKPPRPTQSTRPSSSSSRPTVATKPTATTSTYKSPYAPPTVRATKIARGPAQTSRRGRPIGIGRPNMQAGSISKDFVGIGTKGKQAERANEVLALGRRESVHHAPAPYAGLTMRKAPAAQTSASTGGANQTVADSMHVDSPLEMSPAGMAANAPLPAQPDIDSLFSQVAAENGIEVPSPPNSLFDGPDTDEDEAPAVADVDSGAFVPNVDNMDIDWTDPPPPASRPKRPSISTGTAVTRGPTDGPLSARGTTSEQPFGLSPLLNSRPLEAPQRSVIPLLQPGQWSWTGDVYVTVDEPIPGEEEKTQPKLARVCDTVIRDPVIPDNKAILLFKNAFEHYVQGRLALPGAMDVNLSYAIITSGALEPTQAAWMVCAHGEETPEWELWDGLLRKMEMLLWVSDIRLYRTTDNVELGSRLILIPTTLISKYRHAPNPTLARVVEHFNLYSYTSVPSFVVLMCKTIRPAEERVLPPALLPQIPEHWQEIPPDYKPIFKGMNCLVFPPENHDNDYEVRLMRHQLRQCGANVLEGTDPTGQAGSIFIHRRYLDQLFKLLGFALRKHKYRKRFYVYGSGGNWRVAEWDLREVWMWGGMITFTPAAVIEDPGVVKRVVDALEGKPNWEAYIEPKTAGLLAKHARRTGNSDLSSAIDILMAELATSDDIAFYNLALTAPPKWGKWAEHEWAAITYGRAMIEDADELLASCELEAEEAYKEAKKRENAEKEKEEEQRKEKEKEAREKEEERRKKAQEQNSGSGWGQANSGGWGSGGADAGGWGSGGDAGGWGNGSTDTGGWGNASTDTGGWGNTGGGTSSTSADAGGWGSSTTTGDWGASTSNDATTSNPTPNGIAAPEIDMSGLGSESHMQAMCDEVVEGLKWFQIQPCFMKEIRRFIVIDSSERVKAIKKREHKIPVEITTANELLRRFDEGHWW